MFSPSSVHASMWKAGGGQVMMTADLEQPQKYLLDLERIEAISDEMRAVVESEWLELAQ